MMLRPIALVSVVVLLAVAPASAEVVHVPLPELHGVYTLDPLDWNAGRTAAFDLGAPVCTVYSAHIEWAGHVSSGLGNCVGSEFAWESAMASSLNPNGTERWSAYVGNEGGPNPEYDFDTGSPFSPHGASAWEFLAEGRGEIEIRLSPFLYFCGEMIESPEGTILEAVLVLDLEFEFVPVTPTTWGRIKTQLGF